MKMRSVMEHAFSMVPSAEIPRSSFDRSHGYKTTFDAQYLVPIFVDEALPGDTFNLRMSGFARLATPLFPIMDNMYMETFFFFVPYRLLWDNWEKFNGAQDNPGDSTDFLIPIIDPPAGGFPELSFFDYCGIPPLVENLEVSALPQRAYYLIWNEWFRDENLQNTLPNLTDDGPDPRGAAPWSALFRRGKRHDYFTSCLPFPQKGDSVSIPLGTTADVITQLAEHTTGVPASGVKFRDTTGAVPPNNLASITAGLLGTSATAGVATNAVYPTNLVADLTDATAATINQLRQAFQIQRLLERDARGGTRYTEIVRSHFGVVSPDARLQRPEYLGGGSSRVNVTPVAQTSESGTSPQGTLRGFGTAMLDGHGFTKSFTEHGVIMGLVNVRADLTYQQGVERMWSRQTRFDFYWPALSHIGEQAVLSRELFADGTSGDDDVFGYQERYAEYRYKPSRITGAFRSAYTGGSLDAWHLAEEFSSRPSLDGSFILPDFSNIDRALAVPSEPHFIFDSYFNLRCARPMPLFGVPGFVDHF